MQKGFITPAVALIVATLFIGVPLAAWYTAEPEPQVAEEVAVGGFGDPFTSLQLATDPDSGECLTTNGTENAWSTSCSGSSGAATLDGLNDVTITSSSTGNILYLAGSGQWVNLATGSDGQVLKLASGIPSWDTDNTAAGGSGLGTTTPWTAGQLAVVATDGLVKSIATSTLSENISGLEFDANPWIVGSARTLSLSSGYVIPLTASTTEWAAAHASTTALTPAYIRGLFSNTATGLTYNSSTGATSLTSDYTIPLTASTTEWHNFHTTPSGRITAGTNLTWSGNTLNVDDPFSVTDFSSTNATTSALVVTGQTTLANASTTNLTVSGNSYLGTVTSGIWNGTAITVPYGGTGLTTCTNNYLITGNGTSAFVCESGLTFDGNTLTVNVNGSAAGVDITQAGSGTSLNINNSGSGDFFVVDTSDFVITNAGDVGIDDATPDASLEIVDRGIDLLNLSSSSTGDGDFLTVDTSGNVGIGTTTPSAKLTVVGDLSLQTIAASTTARLFEFSGTGNDYTDIQVNSSGDVSFVADDGSIPIQIGGASVSVGSDAVLFSGEIMARGDTNTYISFPADTVRFTAGGTNLLTLNGGSNISTGLEAWDFGGASLFEIPNGTNPTANDPGEIAHDTSSSTNPQLILDDYVVARGVNKLFSFQLASTSPQFTTGATTTLPTEIDGYTVTNIYCSVIGGTSKIITLFGETITCTTSNTADDGSIASPTAASLSINNNVVASTTSGTVNYLNVSIFGTYTRK